MDKTRFLLFRCELRDLLIKAGNEIDTLFIQLVKTYPELDCLESALPDLVLKKEKKDCYVQTSALHGNNRNVSPAKKPKDMDHIKQQLKESIQYEIRYTDYTNFQPVLDNEETCLQTLKTLDSAEADAGQRLIYFSCLKGEVLTRMQEITGKNMSQLLILTNYSQAYAYFLINLCKLAGKYNKLMYSDLPIRFFQINFKEIENICESEETFFRE